MYRPKMGLRGYTAALTKISMYCAYLKIINNLTSDDFWPCYMTFDCINIQRFTYYINTPNLVQISLQLFRWGHFHIFSLSYNLTSDDLWLWYMTFDLINKWGFPYCIYDPTLVEIHQSMWKIEPNVNPFFNKMFKVRGTSIVSLRLL